MKLSWWTGVGQASEAISYRWRRWVYLQVSRRIPTIRGHTEGNNFALHFSVQWISQMGGPHDHGLHTMDSGRCWTCEEVLGLCCLSGSLSQEPHPGVIGIWQLSVYGLPWEDAIFEASTCFQMLGICPHCERDMKEAGVQNHSRDICWLQHIDYSVPRIWSIWEDAAPLPSCGIQGWEEVHCTKCYRWSDFERTILQRYHRETKPHREASIEHQTEESLGNDPPPEPLKPKIKSRELALLETSDGDASKQPAEGSWRNHTRMDKLVESAQLATEDEEFQDVISIYAAAMISDN